MNFKLHSSCIIQKTSTKLCFTSQVIFTHYSNNYLNHMKSFYLLFYTLLISIKAYTQDPVYRSINNVSGLPSNTVYNILQDKKGFIWLGHDRGLCRYDGKSFKQYALNAQKGRSLSNVLDINEVIWCQDFSGNFYHTSGDSLIQENRFSANGVYNSAHISAENSLAFVTADSVKFFNTVSSQKSALKIPLKAAYGACVYQNRLYFFAQQTFYSSDDVSLKSEMVFAKKLPNFFFLLNKNNRFYAITKNESPYIYRLQGNQILPINVLPSGSFIQDVHVLEDEIWVSTSSGAYCFDLDFKAKYNNHCFFRGISITKIIRDREQNYWFGTINKGVLLVTDINMRLQKFENESMTALSIGDENQILVGTTNNRILAFNTINSTFLSQYKESTNHEVTHIYFDRQTRKTLFSNDRIVYLDEGKKIKELKLAGKDLAKINENLYAIAFSNGISLIGVSAFTPKIPLWLTKDKGSWQEGHYRILDDAPRGRSVYFDTKDSTLYAATARGLLYFSPQGRGEILYENKPIYASQLGFSDGTLFAGTFSDGLFLIKNKTQIVLINKDNSELTKTIYKLQIQGDWVWLVGDELIQRYNLKTKKLIKYTYASGLTKAEIKDILLHKNKIYIATTEGVIVFDNKSTVENELPPTLVTTQFLVNNKPYSDQKSYTLSHTENNISINFSLLAFKTADALQVKYRINDGVWQPLESQSRVLNLPSLSSGIYQISIAAFNESSLQVGNILNYNFSISSPFYKRWWFILLAVSASFFLINAYFKRRLNEIKAKNELLSQKLTLEQELQQSMLSSIKSQMNPHFLFNALNTVQSYIYTNDKENAGQYLGKFSELTRMILDMSNRDSVSLNDEIKALHLYLELEALRFEDKLLYTFDIDDNISLETVHIPSMLIQPYVENAIKHGLLHQRGQWLLTITFIKQDAIILVVVDDNGVGRKRSAELNKNKMKQHQSFASKANQTRLEILNKGLIQNISLNILDKTDAYGNALGTKVTMAIPIVK
jgi:sensor histidine kinase YesM/ligand-binding sensor domain-containing protein